MATVKGKCFACGVILQETVAEACAGAELAAPLCRACTDQQFLKGGGAILRLQREPEGARFPLGKVTITPGAINALASAGEHATAFLVRHT
jgi:hypothetical protein